MSFLTVCLNPTLQKTLCFPSIVPGTVNRTGIHRLDASGKGINVTRVLSQLGKKTVHLTQLGGDLQPLFLSLCEQDGLVIEWVESKSQIRFCYTLLTDDNVTELVEESEKVTAETEQHLLDKFDNLLETPSLSCLIISGTKAAGFSDTVFPTMVRKAKEKGLKIILDIRGKDLIDSLQYEPDIVKPNLFEFVDTFAADLIKGNDYSADVETAQKRIKTIALELCQKYRCRIILTNGARKISVADNENFFEVDIQPVKTINSIGCGDAFSAGLASALVDGRLASQVFDFNAAINEGLRCGALNAGLVKPGVIR